MATSSMNISWEPLRLTHTKPSFNNHELALAARQDLWHKFIIFDVGDYSMETVLDATLASCQPEVLMPMMYHVDRLNKASFLAKCTIAAIDTLVKQGLEIKLPDDHVLKMDIVLGFINMQSLPINQHRVISQVLISRWDSMKKSLNLENFHHEPKLKSIYCPLSSPGVFVFVLKCCKPRMGNLRDNKLPIRELILKNNGLVGVILYEKLLGFSLTKLDLSFNKIENIDYLRYFSEFKITELCLDGNPLCADYSKPEDYIRAVKNVFPHLQKLDGVVIDVAQKCTPMIQQYFLDDGSRLSLIKQFIKHYFTLYDQNDREVLDGLYESDSFFSFTFGDIANPRHRQLTKVLNLNRNLIKVVDYSRCYKYLFQGSYEIIECLRTLPPTFHDYKSFSIDIIHQGHRYVAFSVQGSFFYREFPVSLLFNRTFIVVEVEDNEYRIINDQYHIQSGNSTMIENDCLAKLNVVPTFTPVYLGNQEKIQMIGALSNITTMNKTFCREYLENIGWDLRAAFKKFIKAYTVNNIPPHAFKSIC
ncbi:nuclear RNA export factor 1-like isoform X1 [Chelonus insularis]|uniref:nuclear RNA export factor 1-like isoform X1 n=1 Tax=Chelonus insularis TaxID=460826 RepID=UPI00158B3DA4|nr:nuclear RNA export factor 1-like isoform X1 [Chelonus insularis]XP_034943275.1 nuclear RNA export factor 1-like isoform X1 [Chelonus insularis]XP_034943276.1 nuclear RNA export factor 1-like isoform X1 [Chelonus insularis]XP_034943277.1 nuclear RNA export factor 1-like isoform X1 [Chelonus insularis]XP_034943278.1 nuclear RNA export factor 1-like isoform X1 [Chelonus insularis]